MEAESLIKTFETDIKKCFLKKITNDYSLIYGKEISKETLTKIKRESFEELIINYAHFQLRHPPIKKRKVYSSNEINKNFFFHIFRNEIVRISEAFEKGGNIYDYFSNRDFFYDDKLLNDWGIWHIHLFPRSERHKKCDEYLLFLKIDNEKVFFINIYQHNSWEEKDLLEIAYKYFDDICITNSIKGSSLSEEQIRVFRNNNIHYSLQIEDRTFFSGINKLQLGPYYVIKIKELIKYIANFFIKTYHPNLEKKFQDIHLHIDERTHEINFADYSLKTLILPNDPLTNDPLKELQNVFLFNNMI